MRALILATIVAFFTTVAQAFPLEQVEEVCGSWAQFTYAAAVAQARVPTDEYREGIEALISGEKDAGTARTLRQLVEFVALNKEYSPQDLATAVYEECAVKLSKMEEI